MLSASPEPTSNRKRAYPGRGGKTDDHTPKREGHHLKKKKELSSRGRFRRNAGNPLQAEKRGRAMTARKGVTNQLCGVEKSEREFSAQTARKQKASTAEQEEEQLRPQKAPRTKKEGKRAEHPGASLE